MIGKEKSNQRYVKKQMTEPSYKLVEHCQLRKLQGWRQVKTADITEVFSLRLFPEGHDIATYWHSHIIFIFPFSPNYLILKSNFETKKFLHEMFSTLVFLL